MFFLRGGPLNGTSQWFLTFFILDSFISFKLFFLEVQYKSHLLFIQCSSVWRKHELRLFYLYWIGTEIIIPPSGLSCKEILYATVMQSVLVGCSILSIVVSQFVAFISIRALSGSGQVTQLFLLSIICIIVVMAMESADHF
jgi:hypothetical protein